MNIKKFNQINESSENTVKVSITIEMSEESAKNLSSYFDCNSVEVAIGEHLWSLKELDGVNFTSKVSKS